MKICDMKNAFVAVSWNVESTRGECATLYGLTTEIEFGWSATPKSMITKAYRYRNCLFSYICCPATFFPSAFQLFVVVGCVLLFHISLPVGRLRLLYQLFVIHCASHLVLSTLSVLFTVCVVLPVSLH